MNKDVISLGPWLSQRRKALDLTQLDLAQRVGCSESTIKKIEEGKRRPSKQVAELLAEFLEIPAVERAAFIRFARTEPGHTSPPFEFAMASSSVSTNGLYAPPVQVVTASPGVPAYLRHLSRPNN